MDLKYGTQQFSVNLATIVWSSVRNYDIQNSYSKKEINFTSGGEKKAMTIAKSSKHLTIGELSHKDSLKAIRIHL